MSPPQLKVMKKSFGPLILLILGIVCSYGQGIKYEKTLDDALALSAKNNKPVFVFIKAPIPTDAMIPANVRIVGSTTGLDSKDVIDFYNKKFVSYQVMMTDSAAIKLRNQYHTTFYPAFIFLDSKGQIISKDGHNSRDPEKYMDMANKALDRIASGKTISYYEQLDKAGTITADQLKEYITLREELDMFDNAALADEYVNFLTIKSFDDYSTVLFVLKAGPYAYGKAFNLCHTNKKITDSIFKQEPTLVRLDINNRVIANTRNEAVKKKDGGMAVQAASFASSTWGKNYPQAGKASTLNMMNYYRAVKDTTRYFSQASYYYDTYYMNISTDSAKKIQQKILDDNFTKSIKASELVPNPNLPKNTTLALVAVHVIQGSQENLEVASSLHSGAYEFYTLGTHNPANLVKALLWCRRAIELQSNNPNYYDTMAHIMYRLNFYEEAVLNQNKAIELAADESKTEQDHLKDELAKMRTRKL